MRYDFPGEIPVDQPRLERLALRLEGIIQHDPGGRGLAHWAERGDLLPATRSLLEGSRIAIATGFFIPAAGAIETDGPLGALVLARALIALGKEVVFLVDSHAAGIIEAGLSCLSDVSASEVPMVLLPPGDSPELRRQARTPYSHVVAVERPGRSENGRYHTMRGEDITPHVAAMDELFIAPHRTYRTIGIGDGGNELGLLKVSGNVDRFLGTTGIGSISCRTPADFNIYAGVSNWGGYAVCALLGALTGEPLLPDHDLVTGILQAIVREGAVDGVSRKRALSVDGLPLDEETGVITRLQEITATVPVRAPLGDSAILWTWSGEIRRETSARVLAAYRAIREDTELRRTGMVDVVPSYCALAVHWEPYAADQQEIVRRAEVILDQVEEKIEAGRREPPRCDSGAGTPPEGSPGTTTWRLPVRYTGEDLPRVAKRASLTPGEVVHRHSAADYTVAMIGFRPHFPYLIGMDERIATPRLERPRTKVIAGSVGIAGSQTGAYPVDSPGGWNIIGFTDPELLKPIRPGDTVVFEVIQEEDA
jgi:KipI family sensor histidine kinase inhibitor